MPATARMERRSVDKRMTGSTESAEDGQRPKAANLSSPVIDAPNNQSRFDATAEVIGPVLVVTPTGATLNDDGPISKPNAMSGFSAAVAAFLAMYGFVSHRCVDMAAAPAALAERRWSLALVLGQPDGPAIKALASSLLTNAACVIFEGPISGDLAGALGLSARLHDVDEAAQAAADGPAADWVQDTLAGYARADAINLDPIISTVGRIVTDDAGKKSVVEEAVDSPFHDAANRIQTFEGGDETILKDAAGRGDLLVRKGSALVAGFPVFNLICQRLGVPALPAPWRRARGERNGENLDLLLLLSAARVARENGAPLISVDPWPVGVRYPVTVRQDVDRPVADEDWSRLLDWQTKRGVKATWYYLAKNIDPARMAQTHAMGHEIALHYTNLETRGASELQAIRNAAESINAPLSGVSCHGGNYHGWRDLAWAETSGFSYAEVLTRCAFYPFQPVAYDGDGVRRARLWAAARHLSVDKRMSPPEADFSYGARTQPARARVGGHAIIMNHPDINFEALVEAYDVYARPGTEAWTQGETIEWWRATHAPGAVEIDLRRNGDAYAVHATHAAPNTPVLRVWAAVDGDEALEWTENFGDAHTLFPLTAGASVSFSLRNK